MNQLPEQNMQETTKRKKEFLFDSIDLRDVTVLRAHVNENHCSWHGFCFLFYLKNERFQEAILSCKRTYLVAYIFICVFKTYNLL